MLHITSTRPGDTKLLVALMLLSISQCLSSHATFSIISPLTNQLVLTLAASLDASPLISYCKKQEYTNRKSIKPLMPYQCERNKMATQHLDTNGAETN